MARLPRLKCRGGCPIFMMFPAFVAALGIGGSGLIPLVGILGAILSIIGPSPFL